jgi:hypothetical protein
MKAMKGGDWLSKHQNALAVYSTDAIFFTKPNRGLGLRSLLHPNPADTRGCGFSYYLFCFRRWNDN